MRRSILTLMVVLPLAGWSASSAQAQPAAPATDALLWAKLKIGGHTLLIRHAETDAGIGDPAGFEIGTCSTQRNLSAEGRAHARRIGAAFLAHGIPVGPVLSSRWCRCVDTGSLAFGTATPHRMLDSIFNDPTRSADDKLREVRSALRQPPAASNQVWVTHNYNIDAIAGVSTAPGEIVVMESDREGKQKVIGRLTIL